MHGGSIHGDNIKLDLSININPLGMPIDARTALFDSMGKVGEYPDPKCSELKEKIADYFDVPKGTVVCSNGASELIQTICYMLHPQKALINYPTFSGYERALQNAWSDVDFVELKRDNDFVQGEEMAERILAEKPELVFIANPNNPNGMLLDKLVGEKIVKACNEVNAHLVVDECFIEMTDEGERASLKRFLSVSEGMIIMRAFTKSYGMPGIRLGFGLCSDATLADWIGSYMPEWNISVMAQAAGTAAMAADNTEYFRRSRILISIERKYLTEELTKLGMKVYPSKSNFILFSNGAWRNLHWLLKERGIVIRECSDYRGLGLGFYRICVSKHEDNVLFIETLREIVRG